MTYPGFRFEDGDLVQIDGRLHQILAKGADNIELATLGSAPARRFLSNEEFWKLYRERQAADGAPRLVVVRGALGNLPEAVAQNLKEPLADFALEWQDEALRRQAYVLACDRFFSTDNPVRRGLFPIRPEGYERIAKIVARHRRLVEARDQGKRPCQIGMDAVGGSTLRRWHKRWLKSGRDIRSLLPCHDYKGQAGLRLDPDVVEIVGRHIRETYMTDERPDAKPVYDLVVHEIEEKNKARVNALAVPTYRTFLRCINSWTTPFERTLKRHGAKKAGQDFRATRRAPQPSRPLQVVEIDHTRLDVLVVDDDGKPSKGDRRKAEPYEVWLTVARCMATKMVVGFELSRERPSYVSVMNTIGMGVLEKKLEGIEVRSPYPVFGVWEILKMDNGPEFHSRSIRAMAGQLRMELCYMPRGKPHLKGGIERTIGTIGRDFLSFLPGKLFNNPQARGEYPSKRRAAATLPKLREMMTVYIVDVMHNKPMGCLLGLTPLQKWESLTGFGVRMPPNADDLVAALAKTIERTVTNVGVTYLGLVYQSQELQMIRRREGHLGKMLMVKVDPCDLGSVLVLDEGDRERKGRWIRVPCLYPELADGVSVAEWKETNSLARDRTEAGKRVALATLRAARKWLAEEAARLKKPEKKVRDQDMDWASAHADDPAFSVAPDDGAEAPATPGRGRPRKAKPAAGERNVGDGGHPAPADGDDEFERHPLPVGARGRVRSGRRRRLRRPRRRRPEPSAATDEDDDLDGWDD